MEELLKLLINNPYWPSIIIVYGLLYYISYLIVNCLFDITKEERKLEDQIAECEKEISENEDFQQELKKEFKDKEKEEDDNKAELEGLLKDHKELNRKSAKLRRKLDEQGRLRKGKQFRIALCFTIAFAIIHVLAGLRFYSNSSPKISFEKWTEKFNMFVNEYNQVLPEYSRLVIKKSIENTIFEGPSIDEPSVILLIGSQNNANLVRKMLKSLSTLISQIQDKQPPSLLDGSVMNVDSIHGNFSQLFSSGNYNTAVLDGIDKLPNGSARSLHRYTDHANAAFKNVIILLSAYGSGRFTDPNMKPGEMDKIANDLLSLSWIKDISEDRIYPLLSRLTPSVAIILDKEM